MRTRRGRSRRKRGELAPPLKRVYFCPVKLVYEAHGHTFTTPKGYPSDGATGAIDIYSMGWFAHDRACDVGEWDDGWPMHPSEASEMLGWYLKQEGRHIRDGLWKRMTFWFGPRELGETGEAQIFPEYAGQIRMIEGGRDSLYPQKGHA